MTPANKRAVSNNIQKHILKIAKIGPTESGLAGVTYDSLISVLDEIRRNVVKLEDAAFYE